MTKSPNHHDVRTACVAALAGVLAICTLAAGAAPGAPFDLLVKNGLVLDGSGSKAVRADVAVAGGRIARVGQLSDAEAATVIDASGLVVAPGFIDVHTHADEIASAPLASNFVRMGVTSVIAGNCGGSSSRIGSALAKIREAGTAINVGTLVGHNTVRDAVMGTARRAPTAGELEAMKRLVAEAMTEGALGFSTGLQYVPGAYADQAEIVELAKVAGAAGGVYASHMRNEGTAVEKAVLETIAVGEAAHCPVEISHLKIDSPNRWGASATVLALIDRARGRGVDVRADQYAYTAASSGLAIRFPSWALEGGGEQVKARLEDPPTWQRIKGEMKQLLAERGLDDLSFAVVASYKPDPSLNGLSIKQVAEKQKGSGDADAQFEVAREMMRQGGADMVYHFMSEDDVARIMRHPFVAIASDSDVLTPGEGMPHPRGYGNNARVLGRYVRELKVISLEEAVRKMTSLPASQFRLAGRGLIKEGYAADLVVFDPAAVADRATFAQPHQFPAGIPWVVVNGTVVVQRAAQTGARPGQVLTHAPSGPATASLHATVGGGPFGISRQP